MLAQRVMRVKAAVPLGLLLVTGATLGCQADGRFAGSEGGVGIGTVFEKEEDGF